MIKTINNEENDHPYFSLSLHAGIGGGDEKMNAANSLFTS